MKYKLIQFFMLASIAISACEVLASQINLIMDAKNNFTLPRNFRTTDQIKNTHLIGSAQFSEDNLRYVISHSHKPTYLFDLRQESHCFLNGIAISWYGQDNWANINKSLIQIRNIEDHLLQSLVKQTSVIIYQKKPDQDPLKVRPSYTYNEEQLAAKYKIKYVRIPVLDHRHPDNVQVDRFVSIVKNIPHDEWLYLHCRGGKGRTTSFMAMIDMMHNAKNATFEEILNRQHAIGGQILAKVEWNKKYALLAEKRLEFLKDFYRYCRENKDNFSNSWSEWKNSK